MTTRGTGRTFTLLDAAAVGLIALGLVAVENQHTIDIEATEAVPPVARTSCQDDLENRRFVMRRMMIADGSLPLGARNEALTGTCPRE